MISYDLRRIAMLAGHSQGEVRENAWLGLPVSFCLLALFSNRLAFVFIAF
jgi:hypothetical protein